MIDLDTYHSLEERARKLLIELTTPQGEDQIALHQGERYVPRLARYSTADEVIRASDFGNSLIKSNPSRELVGTCLITGGLGVLGIKLAQWLVSQGVKHLVLCGRQAPSPEVQQTIDELEKAGINIKVAQADVTNATEVSGLLAQIKNKQQESNFPELRNIFHLAGVIDDKGLTQQTWQQFKTVLDPKVLGTWNLHTLTQDIPLDHFVVFSSIVALLGSPGQSNYGAANAFIDALIHYRRAKGLPGLSLNWGGWSEAKVTSHFNSRLQQLWKDYLNQRWQEAGIQLIAPEQGFRVLEQLLKSTIAQVGIIPINWSRFSQTPSINQRPLLSNFINPVNSSDTTPIRIPLSEAQKQLWFLAQISEAGSVAYHSSAYMELRGQLTLEFLRQAIQQVVNRHEALRTVIDPQGEWQEILPSVRLEVPLIDHSSQLAKAENDQQVQLSTWLREINCQPLDLTIAPLLRIQVLKLAPQRHVLVIVAHHIVVDGWSAENILQEISLFYTDLCTGLVTSFKSPLQFREFLTWQNQQSQTEAMAAHKSFWLEQFATEPPVLELPTDQIRPPVKTYRAGRQHLELDPNFCQELRSFSQEQRCTLFMTLLTGYLILLHRLTGQNELVVGIPTSGRSLAGSQTMVGHASHLLPIQSLLEPENITAQEFLARVRTKLLDAYEHQDYPFAELLNQLDLGSDRSRPPLVSVTFNLEPPLPTAPMGDLEIKLLPRPLDFNHYDLEFNVIDLKTHLVLEADYNKDLFQEATIQRWIGHFCAVLQAILHNPQQNVTTLPLLSEQERYQLLREWNNTTVKYSQEECIHKLFEAQVESTPNAIAVVFEDEQVTYHELNTRANQLAHYLQSLGVEPEVLVGVFVERSIEMVVGLLAILKAGGAYIPLDPAYPEERLREMLNDSQASIVLTQQKLQSRLREYSVKIVNLDTQWQVISQESEDNPVSDVQANNLAYVIYTSGSTGKPKGVMICHKSLVNVYWGWEEAYQLQSHTSSYLQMASFSFDVFTGDIVRALCSGGKLVLCPRELLLMPEKLYELMQKEKVDCGDFVPAVIRNLMRYLETTGQNLDFLRVLSVGSDSWYIEEYKQLQKLCTSSTRVINSYGVSESTIDSCYFESTALNLPSDCLVPIGRPFSNTEIYILDTHLEPVPIGVPGDLYIGGAGLARGYLNLPELTKEKFIPNPLRASRGAGEQGSKGAGGKLQHFLPLVSSERLYKTGDLARYLPDGNIEFLGRVDNQVKIRGFRIELTEIEAVLHNHPQIQQAVVIVREDIPGNKRLVAYVDTIERSLTSNQLREFLTSKLPQYMMPSAFVIVDSLPLTANGKIDRKALPAPDGEIDREQEYVAPGTEIEQKLTKIWEELLLKEKVSIHDNFFEIGGDSILSIQVVSRARSSGIQITPKQIFQHQTIAQLAKVANTTLTVTGQQGIVTGSAPLTPIQQWFFAQNMQEAHHYNQSVLLQVPNHLQPELIKTALKKLLEHHDALRLRFTSVASEYKQVNHTPDDGVPFTVIDLSSTPTLEQPQALEKIATEFQARLNLSDGSLMQVVMFNLGRECDARLLIIIHHLAVDGVSWRILLSDLEQIYQQLITQQPIQLAAKTTAFIDWAKKLKEYAQSDIIKQELGYWVNQPWSLTTQLPLDYAHTEQENTVGSAASVSVKLSVEETQALLGSINEAYNTQINDILLTALALSLAEWTGNAALVIDLEGHGREELFTDVDLSRTVGWFTSLFPVLLQLPEVDQLASVIKSIKEKLRGIPNRGIGYGILRYLCEEITISEQLQTIPTPEICFNYLGQFDQIQSATGWNFTSESTGDHNSSKQIRSYLLEIDALVVEGELQIDWTYSSNLHTRTTVEKLACSYVEKVRTIIEHCHSEDSFGCTPSDFSLAKLTQKELDELLNEFNPKNIESIYPLSPVQQGMLFHSLYSPESGVYSERISFSIKGNIDFTAFKNAWKKVLDRHSALRTFFVWENQQTPLQIVLKHVDLSWNNLDWRGISLTEQQQKLKEFLDAQRKTGFNLNQAPLMKCTLIQLSEDSCTFIWNHHHILIDGWCLSILLKEVLSFYEASASGKTLYLPTPSPYQDYITWLHSQDKKAAIEFWQQTLRGFKAPTSLIVHRAKSEKQRQPSDYKKLELRLSAEISRQLQSIAKQHRVTLSSIVQGAWGLLLSHYSGEQDVVFGVSVSGRTGSLPGVENMVGLLINSLPLRLQISPQQQIIPWLKQIQQSIVELQEYSYTPLFEIQSVSELPSGTPLFQSLVGFQNYPIDTSLLGKNSVLETSNIESVGQNNYPLTVLAVPRDEILIEIDYDTYHFEGNTIVSISKYLQTIFSGIAENPQRTVSELTLIKESEKQELSKQSLKKLKQIKRNLIKVESVVN
ncbi:non-ribosomal peptide synthetase [Aetokthonos hydrillicola]|uniref:non-ribosomal peptide synthetase n=1 Tax=Aetokthonos hydrillicola TaxID=1550245 RepID=UPI001ABAEAB4